MLLGFLKVTGHSMLPSLNPGDIVLVSTLPYFFSKPKKNDIVVFKTKNTLFIKRIKNIEKGKIDIEGDNKNDSLPIGFITKKDIIGKVVVKI